MTGEFSILGAKEVREKILQMAREAPRRVADALHVEAQLTMTEAKALAPVVTGTLKSSGYVPKATISGRNIEQVMGFGGAASKYALAVHENPRTGHTYGFGPEGQTYGKRTWTNKKGKTKKIRGFSRVGQWKYLEQPFLARIDGLTDRLLERILRTS